MARYRLAIGLLAAAFVIPSARVEAKVSRNQSGRPAAYLKCSFYAGETQLLNDTDCVVTTRPKERVVIKETAMRGYAFNIIPEGERYKVLWNGAPSTAFPSKLLGYATFESDADAGHCWMSIPHSKVPFSLCIEAPKHFEGSKPK